MKICVISSSVFKIPVAGYSGLEHLAWLQAKGLAELGHEVALVAPEGSTCPGVTCIPTGPEGAWDEKLSYSKYWHFLPQFDAIIDNSWQKWSYKLKQEGKLKAPVLGVTHAPVNTMMQSLPPVEKPCFVCISQDQANHFEALFSRQARVAYNGCFAADTLLRLENGTKERIDSFVRRKGREKVLAWDAIAKALAYTEVTEWLELLPSNGFAVEIKTEGAEPMLISTPDNPIMTKDGWKAAHLLSCHDEVLYAEDGYLDGDREGVRQAALRKEEIESDGSGDQSLYVGNQRLREEVRDKKNPSGQHASVMDGRGGHYPQETFQYRYTRRVTREIKTTHDQGDKEPCRLLETTKKKGSVSSTQTVSKNSYGSLSNQCCLFSGTDRRRGLCEPCVRQEQVHPLSQNRNSQQRSANNRLHKSSFTDNGMVGGTREQRPENCSEKTDLAGSGQRSYLCRCDSEDNSIYDGQESESGGVSRVLRDNDGIVLQEREQIHGETNTTISLYEGRKLATWRKVVSIKRIPTPSRVFDLCTGTRNFVANDVVVHNCDLSFYAPLGLPRSDRYLFLARFSSVKSPDIAIQLCLQAGVGLDMIGDTSITNEPDYFKHCLALAEQTSPSWDKKQGKQIRIHGSATRGECVRWFSQARGLIHYCPNFREPFGLSPCESMACGTPVLAYSLGGVKETIEHGKTGFVVNSTQEALDVLQSNKMDSLNRNYCREWVSKFSVENMVLRYQSLCQEALEGGGW